MFIDDMLTEVKQAISVASKSLSSAPDGFLRTRCVGGVVRYFRRERGETEGRYLGKCCEKEIRQLEEKAYYTQLLETAQKQEAALEKIKAILDKMPDYKAVFLNIMPEKRHLIGPYEYVRPEQTEVVRFFEKKPVSDELKLVTQNGEHVRSKSELIIADRLKANGIPYFYEDPLIMAEEGYGLRPCLYWHPDFRVQNIRTGRQYYWEHLGMLDNTDYCAKSQNKLELYAKYGYFPGENLIITSESSGHSLNLDYVDCLIEKYLK